MTGIRAAKPGEFLGTIGYEISRRASELGYSIIKEFVGHGIGKKFHTQPYVLHFGVRNTGIKLIPGMIFTIEPILCRGNPTIYMRNDWEAVLKSGLHTAQAEHTILITPTGPEILTDESSSARAQNSKASVSGQ
jgi:methionyl aminopeptidase